MTDHEQPQPKRAWADPDADDADLEANQYRPARGFSDGDEPESDETFDAGADADAAILPEPDAPAAAGHEPAGDRVPAGPDFEEAPGVEPLAALAGDPDPTESEPADAEDNEDAAETAYAGGDHETAALTPGEVEPARGASSNRTRTLIAAGTVVAVMALLTGGIWFANQGPRAATTPSPVPTTPAPDPLVTTAQLLSVNDAKLVNPKLAWRVVITQETPTVASPTARCLNLPASGQPVPEVSRLRTLSAPNGPGTVALHQADGYANTADAEASFALRRSQLGACDPVPAYLMGGSKISGLGDDAVAVKVSLPDEPTHYHTIVLTRTGRIVNVFDFANTATTFNPAAVVKAAAAVVGRECRSGGGKCPAQQTVVDAPPPAAGEVGWLLPVDLPRVSPNAGAWSATKLQPVSGTIGTGCENLDLATFVGPTQRGQRTYALTQDPAVPADFGMDEVILKFANPKAAEQATTTLSDNLTGCTKRSITATVTGVKTVTGNGQNAAVTGKVLKISQKKTSGSITFRVAVAQVGSRLVYLRLNPTSDFDFGDGDWQVIALRAAQRASQLP